MTRKKILFVDDEPNILLGLKRMLHSMRKEMDFFFAEGGKEALIILAEQDINVIVSDMRMPGMDGAALLNKVMEQYPQVIRIMLTGHIDDHSIVRSIPVVHQFLSKPSEPESLKEVLTRACALQELITSERLKTLVASLGSLPSLPEVYAELQDKAHDPECDIGDIAKIIGKDLAMSAKVLQLVNSAFFGLYKRIDSPARAVNLLGLDTIKTLILGVGIFTEMAPVRDKGLSVSALWRHSVTTATFAKEIASLEGAENAVIENSFIAGIVHDVGKLLLLSSLSDQYCQVVENAKTQSLTLFQAEQQMFEADHGDVGGYLMGLWGLPGVVVEALTFHHKLGSYPEASFCPALAVHAADVVYYMLNPELCVGKPPVINLPYLEEAGLDHRFGLWLELCKEIQSENDYNQ